MIGLGGVREPRRTDRLRRVVTAAALTAAAFGATGVLAAPMASAHPLGNFTVNRYSGIVIFSDRVEVTYVVDMAEIPTFQTLSDVDASGDGSPSPAERQAWADRTAPALLAGVALSVDGRAVPLGMERASMELLPGQGGLQILYLRAVFSAPLPSATGQVEYRDTNYADRIGWKEITVRADDGISLSGSNVPESSVSQELRSYPQDLLSSPLDLTGASFSFRPGPRSGSIPALGDTERGSTSPASSGGSFADLVTRKLTPGVLALSLVLAFAFGALHALGPGHGKTIMAAYLVGAGARLRQAVSVGLAVTLMHTASVIGLGLIALYASTVFPSERVYPWLGFVAGAVVLALGAALLVSRIRARRRGEDAWHPLHGHSHPGPQAFGDVPTGNGHRIQAGGSFGSVSATDLDRAIEGSAVAVLVREHEHDGRRHVHPLPDVRPGAASAGAPGGVSRKGLTALAVSGGLLPSPTALVVLLGAISLHRLAYGLALIGAFSLGLAAALMAVGLVALRARSIVSRRVAGRLAGWLPLASAAMIFAVGIYLTARAVAQLG